MSVKFDNKKITKILWNNIEYLEDLDIANAFNQYFCSVARDLDSELPYSSIDPLSYLPPRNSSSMFLSPILPDECSRIITSLKKVKQDQNSISVNLFVQNHVYFLRTVYNNDIILITYYYYVLFLTFY